MKLQFIVFLAENCHFHVTGFSTDIILLLHSVKVTIFCSCKKLSLWCFRLLYRWRILTVCTSFSLANLGYLEAIRCHFEAKNGKFGSNFSGIQSYLIFSQLQFTLHFHRTLLAFFMFHVLCFSAFLPSCCSLFQSCFERFAHNKISHHHFRGRLLKLVYDVLILLKSFANWGCI